MVIRLSDNMEGRNAALGAAPDDHYLFDLEDDPEERRNLVGTSLEKQAVDRLRAALLEVEAPADQLERIGLGLSTGASNSPCLKCAIPRRLPAR